MPEEPPVRTCDRWALYEGEPASRKPEPIAPTDESERPQPETEQKPAVIYIVADD